MGILTGKVAVITGSSRGFGFAVAEAFAKEGAAVVLGARNENSLNQAVSSLQNQEYAAAGRVCDVSRQADLENLGELAIQHFGHLDIWVNNAGVGASYGPTMEVETGI